jgi:tRNA (guanosine-2'-O-)-methyltransferase
VTSRSLTSTELKRLHRSWRRRVDSRLALVLDGVQNPFNLGAIARTAAANGVDRAWLVGPVTQLRGPKAQKLALGSDRFVAWSEAASTSAALEAARADGYRLTGVELGRGAAPLFQLDLRGDVCLVLGHEERGLSNAALEACDRLGYVPLTGKVGSLNVAAAAAVALYEARRQGWAGTAADGTVPPPGPG